MSQKILIVDDEAEVVDLVGAKLRANGYAVIAAETGPRAIEVALHERPNLILLDLTLPQMSGLEVCRALRGDAATFALPIILLTARAGEGERIEGLEAGADDCVTKPFSLRELVLRIGSLLRRRQTKATFQERFQTGDLALDRSRHEVRVKGKAVDLTATEFKLLAALLERGGQVLGRERLLDEVWDDDAMIGTRTIDAHVRRLREKLGDASDYIETVRGFGYRVGDRRPGVISK